MQKLIIKKALYLNTRTGEKTAGCIIKEIDRDGSVKVYSHYDYTYGRVYFEDILRSVLVKCEMLKKDLSKVDTNGVLPIAIFDDWDGKAIFAWRVSERDYYAALEFLGYKIKVQTPEHIELEKE